MLRIVLNRMGRDALLILAALGVLAAVLAFGYVASEVSEGGTLSLDRAVLVAMRTEWNLADAWGSDWVEDWMRDITALGSAAVLILMSLFAAGFLLFRRQARAFLVLAASMLDGIGASTLLKGLKIRTRKYVFTLLHNKEGGFDFAIKPKA